MPGTQNDEPAPRTIRQLADWMRAHCFNFNGYSVDRNEIGEGFVIGQTGGLFTWSYTERGQQTPLQSFSTEEAIVRFAHNQIRADRWAKAHCIGFVTEQHQANDLAAKLTELSIDFWQDVIPHFYGPNQPAYRTFVFGCDINRVGAIRKEYDRSMPPDLVDSPGRRSVPASS